MKSFKTSFTLYTLLVLLNSPRLISTAPQPQPHPQPQTGSSFFYYFSPNQPMVLNSQTFGTNAQAYHHTSNPSSSSGDQGSNSNPFNFIPSDQTRNQNGNFPPSNPFLPQRNANVPAGQISPYQASLLDKIAFTHGPPLPLSQPTPTQQPPSNSQYHSQYHNNYRLNPPPQPTPTSQPPAKHFNFLNQPYQFFQNDFHNRFPFGNQQQTQQQTQPAAEQTQEIYDDQEDYDDNGSNLQSRPVNSQPPRLAPLPPLAPTQPSRGQSFYTYYDTGSRAPARIIQSPPKTTPLTFSVKQYFTTKTTKGPASYTFTIEANPTVGPRPTAKVHVSVGGDTLPATFPTLPPSLFANPSPPTSGESPGTSGESKNQTATPEEKNKQNQVLDELQEDYEEDAQPAVVTTTSTTTPTPQPEASTPAGSSSTTETPVEAKPEVSQADVDHQPQLELVPPALSSPEPQPEHVTESASPSSSSTTTTSTTTPEPEMIPSSTTTSTTEIPTKINIDQENYHHSGRRPVKRVIVRKKLATGERVRLTEADLQSVRDVVAHNPQQNELTTFPEKVKEEEKVQENLPSPSQSTEIILPQTTPLSPAQRPNKRPILVNPTISPEITTPPHPTTTESSKDQQQQQNYPSPTTFRYNSLDFNFNDGLPITTRATDSPPPPISSFIYHPSTTTTEAEITSTTPTPTSPPSSTPTPTTERANPKIPFQTINTPIKHPPSGEIIANNDYEYYDEYEYYDQMTESSTTSKSKSTSASTTTQAPPPSSSSTPITSTTEEPTSSSTTTELSSTSTEEPNYIQENVNDDQAQEDQQVTSTIPSLLLEEEFIEPLSTTEPSHSYTSSTTEKEEKVEQSTTEKVDLTTSTERIYYITTYRPSPYRLSTSTDSSTTRSESEPEVTSTVSSGSSSSTSSTTEPPQPPKPDYDDASPSVEIGGESPSSNPEPVKESEVETSTDPPTPAQISQNTTFPQQSSSTNLSSLPENPSFNPSSDYFHPDEYFSSQEEYVAQDPLEDERIHEAQRHALNTALKNIRSRQQNSSSTTEKSVDDENSKKYIRRPTKVNSFPSSTSVSVSFSSHEVMDDDPELGDSRTNIINKIQTFRTKLRKVVNRTGRKWSTTTKRPRRVTRPSLTSSSSTVESLPELENQTTIAEIEAPQQRSVGGGSQNVVDLPEKVQKVLQEDAILEVSTWKPSPTTSTPAPTISTTTNRIPEQKVTPKVLVDSLIITEILPTTTQPSTTTTLSTSTTELTSLDQEEPMDFDTENEEISSSTISSTTSTELSPTTEQVTSPSSLNLNETVIVETSTSRSVRERKVKVVLKRRKGTSFQRGRGPWRDRSYELGRGY